MGKKKTRIFSYFLVKTHHFLVKTHRFLVEMHLFLAFFNVFLRGILKES